MKSMCPTLPWYCRWIYQFVDKLADLTWKLGDWFSPESPCPAVANESVVYQVIHTYRQQRANSPEVQELLDELEKTLIENRIYGTTSFKWGGEL